MKNLYAYLIKTFFGVDLKCDICGRVCKTERGKNVHRASHTRLFGKIIIEMEKRKKQIDIAHKHVIKEFSHSHNLKPMTLKDLHNHKHIIPTHARGSRSPTGPTGIKGVVAGLPGASNHISKQHDK